MNVGHLMVLLHFGNMRKDTVMYNTRRFAEDVIPRLRSRFDEWNDHWWPRDDAPGSRPSRAARRRAPRP